MKICFSDNCNKEVSYPSTKFCTNECRINHFTVLNHAKYQKVRDDLKERAKSHWKKFKISKTDVDKNKLVSLVSMGYEGVERNTLINTFVGLGVKPGKVLFKKNRIDGRTITYEVNAYHIQQLEDKIRDIDDIYKQDMHRGRLSSMNTLLKVRNKMVKVLED